MDILCLMGLFPDEYKEEIQRDSKSGMQNAANKLQWAIVNGLDQIDDVNVSILNSLYIGSYPRRYAKLMIPTFKFKHSEKSDDINVGFCNLTGIKLFSRYRGIKKEITKWAKKPTQDQKAVLIYALAAPFTNIAGYIKNRFPDIKVCIVVPDLPEYMRTGADNKLSVYWMLKKREIKMIRKCIRDVDSYVLLTDAMKEWFGYPVKYTVVEGIAIDAQKNLAEAQQTSRKKTLLYAGGIKEEYGVLDLVRSFTEINNKDWELAIYGDGSDLQKMKDIAADFPNVKIYGMVPNSVVLDAQKESSVLVNPRKNQIFTKYSFPSKILEYMSSGTPVLAYRLDGMPDDYEPYFFHIEEKEDGMRSALEHVMSLSEDELCEMGSSAMHFAAEHKNPRCQCQKIVDMIKSL